MGNYIFRSPFNRSSLNKMLMILPQWMLPVSLRPTKPLSLPSIDESLELPSDDDSTIFNTPVLEQSNKLPYQLPNQRRMTFTCPDTNSKHIEELTAEIKALRDAVASLTIDNNIDPNKTDTLREVNEERETTLQENWKEIHNEENFNIKRRRCRSFIETKGNIKTEGNIRPNLKEVLKDLGNIKLKPVVSSTPKFSPKNDVRNDLHKILLRRFSAMHSPMNIQQNSNTLHSLHSREVGSINENGSYCNGSESDSDNLRVTFEEK